MGGVNSEVPAWGKIVKDRQAPMDVYRDEIYRDRGKCVQAALVKEEQTYFLLWFGKKEKNSH